MKNDFWYDILDIHNGSFALVVSIDYVNSLEERINLPMLEERIREIRHSDETPANLSIMMNDKNPNLLHSIGAFNAGLDRDYSQVEPHDEEHEAVYRTHNIHGPEGYYVISQAFFEWTRFIEIAKSRQKQ